MNKKMLSLLLAVSMVFSTTAVALADEVITDVAIVETTATAEENVEVQSGNSKQSENSLSSDVLGVKAKVSYNNAAPAVGKVVNADTVKMTVSFEGIDKYLF